MLVLIVATAACGSHREPLVPHPQGYAARMEAADAHSERAERYRQDTPLPDTVSANPQGYQCGDTVMSDQLTSGGQRVVQSVPCWDAGEEQTEHTRFLAAREQRLADGERRTATRLVEAEQSACRGLSERELEHSPFAHRREISAVIPHHVTGTLRGVRIVWKPVPGLTADWMRRALDCHRARFERLGEPAIYFPDDPTLVAHATATVEQHGSHIEVVIDAADDLAGQIALDRALDLVRPRTAIR